MLFITAILDYCSSLFSGVGKALLYQLQLVHDAAATMAPEWYKEKYVHITPTLA